MRPRTFSKIFDLNTVFFAFPYLPLIRVNLRLEVALGDDLPVHGRVRAEGSAREVVVGSKQKEDVVVEGYAHFGGEDSESAGVHGHRQTLRLRALNGCEWRMKGIHHAPANKLRYALFVGAYLSCILYGFTWTHVQTLWLSHTKKFLLPMLRR